MNYYNEIDPYVAQWLRNLIDAGHIPFGVVDTRSIEDVTPADLAGFIQCHFFAGIGGWARALKLAGWPDERQVWTASCPCQPFSAAGQGAGFADERHLWPAFFHLAEQLRPAAIFGEQVASNAVDAWIDLVHADLEGVEYRFASIPYPAAGVGAPHIRDRNIWVADTDRSTGQQGSADIRGWPHGSDAQSRSGFGGGVPLGLADTRGPGLSECECECKLSGGAPVATARQTVKRASLCVGGLADTDGRNASAEREQCSGQYGFQPQDGGVVHTGRPGPINGFWSAADWLLCRDGKWRPVEPGTFPLAHGVSNRVGRLRAYGNAIVPPAVAEFIKAYLACQP